MPKKYWKHTPLAMRATAGLRLLPTEKADGLLNEVFQMLLIHQIRIIFMTIIYFLRYENCLNSTNFIQLKIQ